MESKLEYLMMATDLAYKQRLDLFNWS